MFIIILNKILHGLPVDYQNANWFVLVTLHRKYYQTVPCGHCIVFVHIYMNLEKKNVFVINNQHELLSYLL